MNLSSPINLIIAGFYFLIVGVITLFSLFGVYILIRYGKSYIFSVAVGVLYSFFFLTLLFQSYNLLTLILA
jgi:hypothetical protein